MAHYRSAIEHGRVAESGTYTQLVSAEGQFNRLVSEFASSRTSVAEKAQLAPEADRSVSFDPHIREAEQSAVGRLSKKHVGRAAGTGKLEVREPLDTTERKLTGIGPSDGIREPQNWLSRLER